MSETEIRRDFKYLLADIVKASEYMESHDVNHHFIEIFQSLLYAGIEMVKMLESPKHRSNFDYDGWYQEKVFHALEELSDYC